MFSAFRWHALRHTPLFSHLSREERKLLLPFLDKFELSPEERLNERWHPGQWVFWIISGELDTWGLNRKQEDFFVGTFRSGDLVTSPHSQHDYQPQYVTKGLTQIFAIPRLTLEQVSENNPRFKQIYRELQKRELYRYILVNESTLAQAHEDIVEMLVRQAKRYTIKTNTILAQEGKPYPGFFVLLNGVVWVYRAGKRLGTFNRGAYWGEQFSVAGSCARFTLVAAGNIETLVIEPDLKSELSTILPLLKNCQPQTTPKPSATAEAATENLVSNESNISSTRSRSEKLHVGPPLASDGPVNSVDRRKNKRHYVQYFSIPVSFTSPYVNGSARIVDVSDGGLFIESSIVCAPGTELNLQIEASEESKTPAMFARGQIVRVSPIGFSVRLNQTDLNWGAFVEQINNIKQQSLIFKRFNISPLALEMVCEETHPKHNYIAAKQFQGKIENISMSGIYLRGNSRDQAASDLLGRSFHCRIHGIPSEPFQATVVRTDAKGGVGLQFNLPEGESDLRGALGLLVLDLKKQVARVHDP